MDGPMYLIVSWILITPASPPPPPLPPSPCTLSGHCEKPAVHSSSATDYQWPWQPAWYSSMDSCIDCRTGNRTHMYMYTCTHVYTCVICPYIVAGSPSWSSIYCMPLILQHINEVIGLNQFQSHTLHETSSQVTKLHLRHISLGFAHVRMWLSGLWTWYSYH